MVVAEKVKEVVVDLRVLHEGQAVVRRSKAKRKVLRAGRRWGKTVFAGELAGEEFVEGGRVTYATPTLEQMGKFWYEVCTSFKDAIDAGVVRKDESEHVLEIPGTEVRIKAKTAWNADTLRGDWATLLILDEYQLMDERAWGEAGQPMLADKDGDVLFIYTPPSLEGSGVSKAKDPRHAAKMFQMAMADETGEWESFHGTSYENPFISQVALGRFLRGMTMAAYRREILAEDDEVQASWLVYPFREDTNRISDFKIPKDWLVYVGHDFGRANPAALFTAQDTATGNFYEFHEYAPKGGSAAQHVEHFKKVTDGYQVIWRSGGSHQEEEQRELYTAHGWHIVEPKINRVPSQVGRVIDMMQLNKIFIFKSLTHRMEELANCLWELDDTGKTLDKIKDEAKYHLSACARYMYCNFVPETVQRLDYMPIWGF